MKIGKYNFSRSVNDNIWIQTDEGEGMEVLEDAFEDFLDEVWKEYF